MTHKAKDPLVRDVRELMNMATLADSRFGNEIETVRIAEEVGAEIIKLHNDLLRTLDFMERARNLERIRAEKAEKALRERNCSECF